MSGWVLMVTIDGDAMALENSEKVAQESGLAQHARGNNVEHLSSSACARVCVCAGEHARVETMSSTRCWERVNVCACARVRKYVMWNLTGPTCAWKPRVLVTKRECVRA